jgi:hypothetical protein
MPPLKFKPTRAQVREMERENRRWPEQLQAVPKAQWPFDPFEHAERVAMYRSRRFLVQIFSESGFIRLTISRTEWDPSANAFRDGIRWEDLQRLKAEAGYPDAWAVEVFPPEIEIINVAPMRHLWILAEAPAFGWHRDR